MRMWSDANFSRTRAAADYLIGALNWWCHWSNTHASNTFAAIKVASKTCAPFATLLCELIFARTAHTKTHSSQINIWCVAFLVARVRCTPAKLWHRCTQKAGWKYHFLARSLTRLVCAAEKYIPAACSLCWKRKRNLVVGVVVLCPLMQMRRVCAVAECAARVGAEKAAVRWAGAHGRAPQSRLQ